MRNSFEEEHHAVQH